MYKYCITRFRHIYYSGSVSYFLHVAHVLRAWTTANWHVPLCGWKWILMPATIIVSTWKWPTGLECPTAMGEPLTEEQTVQASLQLSIKSVPQETATQF